MPCSEKRARLLLSRGRARVHRVLPFVIRLTDRSLESCALQPLAMKIDPGSITSGLAIVREQDDVMTVLSLAHLIHRGREIVEKLLRRYGFRRRRRYHLRYRKQRLNRRATMVSGWLPPSQRHRIQTIQAWVQRFCRWFPIAIISVECVRFEVSRLEASENEKASDSRRSLLWQEKREYLLEKWAHRCAYCDAKGVPLNMEHVQPKAHGGSDRLSNLVVACVPCNQKKAARPVAEFLQHRPKRLAMILADLRSPLRDTSAVTATRRRLLEVLRSENLPVHTGSGAETCFNRRRYGLPKDHGLDAVCVGTLNHITRIQGWRRPILLIRATGRGAYQRTRLDRFGFPRGYLMRSKQAYGFQTGDLVRAVVDGGKKQGVYVGRVAVRKEGSFNIQTKYGVVQGIWHKCCTHVQRSDGYGYHVMGRVDQQPIQA